MLLEARLIHVNEAVTSAGLATPAQAILGRDFRITLSRGQVFDTELCQRTLATWHPAAILRAPEKAQRDQMREELISDLRQAL